MALIYNVDFGLIEDVNPECENQECREYAIAWVHMANRDIEHPSTYPHLGPDSLYAHLTCQDCLLGYIHKFGTDIAWH